MNRDLFMPDWNDAPDWAMWHTVSEEGEGEWWEDCPIVNNWFDVDEQGNDLERETWDRHEPLPGTDWQKNYDWLPDIDGENVKGMDWRNSLRHRP